VKRRLRGIGLAAACCAVLEAGAAGPAWATSAAITLSPKVGPPTTKVAVTGTGFGASETVVVDFSSTQVASPTTSSTGSLSTSFMVPKAALPGYHLVKATGRTSGRSATAYFLVRANWPKFHATLAGTGLNPYENVLNPANVAQLTPAWSSGTSSYIWSSPAVVNGVVYIGSQDGNLYAYSAGGTIGCTGTRPDRSCTPLWVGPTTSQITSSPAVSNGVAYIGSEDGKLYAFSAAASTKCSGTPKTCPPLWTGTMKGGIADSSPAVANGVVYVGADDDKLYAFSAAGTTNCSGTPKTCQPLWTGATGGYIISSPAVVSGVVYVGSDDHDLYAFDAAGMTNCSGTPKTCRPLWTGATGSPVRSSPAVANGVVYVGSNDGYLYAFGAGSTSNCSGIPKTCTPLWRAYMGVTYSSPAVAGGVVYVGSEDNYLYAFSAAGTTGCSGSPKTCSPLWTAYTSGPIYSSPAVANGVVYIGSFDGMLYAFSAAAGSSCNNNVPKDCFPLWNGTTGYSIASSPAVANGMVFVGSSDGAICAFSR